MALPDVSEGRRTALTFASTHPGLTNFVADIHRKVMDGVGSKRGVYIAHRARMAPCVAVVTNVQATLARGTSLVHA